MHSDPYQRLPITWRSRVVQYCSPFVIAIVLALGVVIFGWVRHGSLQRSIAWISGSFVSVETYSLETAPAKKGDKFEIPFRVRNLTSKNVRIVGANVQCSCLKFINLPLDVPPHFTATVLAELTALEDLKSNTVDFGVEFLFDEAVPAANGKIEVRFAAN